MQKNKKNLDKNKNSLLKDKKRNVKKKVLKIKEEKEIDEKNIKKKVFSEKIKSQLFLLQGYYSFLYLGKFLEQIIMYNDLSGYADDVSISTGDKTTFVLNKNILKDKLKLISENPGKKNVFGYFVELSSFRGIVGVMNELLETKGKFRPFVETIFGEQYFDFEHIIKFVRNVLIHATSPQLFVGIDSFEKHRNFLSSKNKLILNINFNYSRKINGRKGSKDYGVDINIDFTKIYSGKSFWKVISLHQLYLLSELCYNLTLVYIKHI